jgi:hypothetical protein
MPILKWSLDYDKIDIFYVKTDNYYDKNADCTDVKAHFGGYKHQKSSNKGKKGF